MTEEGLDHITVSSCIFLEDETAQTTANGVEEKVWYKYFIFIFIF